MFGFIRRFRRNEIKERPFPPEWLGLIERNVPYFNRLCDEDKRELLGHVQVFLEEKSFEGCGGLAITDEIRVTIAAQACILLLRRDTDYYADLEVILVYPSKYIAPKKTMAPGGIVIEGEQARLGESWDRGVVVLAWDSVLSGARDIRDGHNVVLHEFAHQLDQEEGGADGAPELPCLSMYTPWARVLGKAYNQLLDDIHNMKPTLIDDYGATNPAEFFAVVTETFFEKPKQLKAKHPALYEQLKAFYCQDPAELVSAPKRP